MIENPIERITLLDAAVSPVSGGWRDGIPMFKAIQASITNGGSAVVNIEVSNDAKLPILLGTLTLSAGTPSDFILSDAPWVDIRATLVSVSGGAVTVTLGGI